VIVSDPGSDYVERARALAPTILLGLDPDPTFL
jgi:hypothetical protein